MRRLIALLFVAALLCVAQHSLAQSTTYRYATLNDSIATTFYALDGSTGQLRYMNDNGEYAGVWRSYGNPLREKGSNSLQFAALKYDNGRAFYAVESSTGQLYYLLDFGNASGVWLPYGTPARFPGAESIQFAVEHIGNGAKFTGIDANTGQVYFMFDFGDEAGRWHTYGEIIQK